jgi:hypothetical protein
VGKTRLFTDIPAPHGVADFIPLTWAAAKIRTGRLDRLLKCGRDKSASTAARSTNPL